MLHKLKIDHSVHSFIKARSIVTNATPHNKQNYIANVDITDFFGSITREMVISCLVDNGFSRSESELIAALCTLEDHLPQGAPTSPTISNAILYRFDIKMRWWCEKASLKYTRYADDITISGIDKGTVEHALQLCQRYVEQEGFSLNPKKRRIISKNARQVVTGLVVNDVATLPREKMRRIRAIFHQAGLRPSEYTDRMHELSGYIGLINSIRKPKYKVLCDEYRKVLELIANKGREVVD
jgi:retron-type reverse transcriptase